MTFYTTTTMLSLYTVLSTQNTTESSCVIVHTQNTTTLQPNVFLTGNTLVTVHKEGTAGFSKRKTLSRST